QCTTGRARLADEVVELPGGRCSQFPDSTHRLRVEHSIRINNRGYRRTLAADESQSLPHFERHHPIEPSRPRGFGLGHDVIICRPERFLSNQRLCLLLPEDTVDLDAAGEKKPAFEDGDDIHEVAGSNTSRPEEIASG